MNTGHGADDAQRFALGEDRRQAFRLAGTNCVDRPDFLLQNLALEEKQRTEGLILGGGRDVAVNSQVGNESLDFGAAHFFRVAFVVEEDEALDPVQIGVFRADGIVLRLKRFACQVEEFPGGCGWRHRGRGY